MVPAHCLASSQRFARGSSPSLEFLDTSPTNAPDDGSGENSGHSSNAIYNEAAAANVREFYRCVTEKDYTNATAKRAVDSTLTAILGREAMARKCVLTLDELIRENKKLEVDLKGLKA